MVARPAARAAPTVADAACRSGETVRAREPEHVRALWPTLHPSCKRSGRRTMKPEDIKLTDWKRILLGNAPADFLIEVLLRTLIIYLALIVTMRIAGKRMTGQLTILEMGVMICLGAIVSVPMQMPQNGVLVGMLLLGCMLVFQRGLGRLGFERRNVELLAHGDLVPLVKDGELLTDQLRAQALSREQLYAVLREQNVYQLGQVKRVYLEACGEFSIFKRDEPEPGLCILPEKDPAIRGRCPADGRDLVACSCCGAVAEGATGRGACPKCGERTWSTAVN